MNKNSLHNWIALWHLQKSYMRCGSTSVLSVLFLNWSVLMTLHMCYSLLIELEVSLSESSYFILSLQEFLLVLCIPINRRLSLFTSIKVLLKLKGWYWICSSNWQELYIDSCWLF
jgi:hypothetical protein